MKMKLSTIEAAREGLNVVLKFSMPVKLSYAVSKNLKKIVSELEGIEKSRLELVKKYGLTNEKGITQVTTENMETFTKDLADVLAAEVELDLWKISLSKLAEAGVRITPEQLMTMDDFIDDDTQVEPAK
jgi:hypothetical protein